MKDVLGYSQVPDPRILAIWGNSASKNIHRALCRFSTALRGKG